MASIRTVEKVVQKFKIGEQPSDFAYWQTRTPQERLSALEKIRREWHAGSHDLEQGLQRVCRIVKCK